EAGPRRCGPRARSRPSHAGLVPRRHLQGAQRALFGEAGGRVGPAAESQRHLRRRAPARDHGQGRPAGAADRATAARRAPRRLMPLPALAVVRRFDTHRLVPSKHTPESVLVRIADDDRHLRDIFDLDQATNDRLAGEAGALEGVGPYDLVFGVPYAPIVNAAFCHAHPLGARFNGPERGAWYAGFELETAQAEVAFHKSVELAEI